mgnify:FL=1
MRALTVHMLLWTLASSLENLPTFTFHEEKSLDGSPSLSINFPNGLTDKLILSKHEDSEESHCHYIGHLENERDACVAMTGCVGQDDLDFTIYSQYLKEPVLQLTKEGKVRLFDTNEVYFSHF